METKTKNLPSVCIEACTKLGLVFVITIIGVYGAAADDLPPFIAEFHDPKRGADGSPSASWIKRVYEPRCTAIRVAELENLCAGGIDHPHCEKLLSKIKAGGYSSDIMKVVEIFRDFYANPQNSKAGGLFSADLKTCRGFKLDITRK